MVKAKKKKKIKRKSVEVREGKITTMVSDLMEIVVRAKVSAVKFDETGRGWKARGADVRKHMQSIKTLAQQIRMDIQEIVNEG